MRRKKSFVIVAALATALVLAGAAGGEAQAKTTSPLSQTLSNVKSKVAAATKKVTGKVAGIVAAAKKSKTTCLNGNVTTASLGKNKKGLVTVSYAKKGKIVTKKFSMTKAQYDVARDRGALYNGATIKVCTAGSLNGLGSVALKGNIVNLNPTDGDGPSGGGGSGGGDNGDRTGTGAIGG